MYDTCKQGKLPHRRAYLKSFRGKLTKFIHLEVQHEHTYILCLPQVRYDNISYGLDNLLKRAHVYDPSTATKKSPCFEGPLHVRFQTGCMHDAACYSRSVLLELDYSRESRSWSQRLGRDRVYFIGLDN